VCERERERERERMNQVAKDGCVKGRKCAAEETPVERSDKMCTYIHSYAKIRSS
jgi:hypothetical protein